jgi:hypothetical protein
LKHIFFFPLALLFTGFIFWEKAKALELYSIVYSECRHHTGLILDVEQEHLLLLDTKGESRKLPRQAIETILVYNTVENPLSGIDLRHQHVVLPRKVTIQGEPDFEFAGWPIRFLEDLIVFYDIQGKSHLVNVEQVKRFESASDLNRENPITLKHISFVFGFGSNMPRCRYLDESESSKVQPTRMLSDRISISKFLAVYQKGFDQLDRFESRTGYYARPYLYDTQTKLALLIQYDRYRAEIPQGLPLNFQWSTGRNFGPQGKLTLGLSEVSTLPNIEPVFAVQFSGKYHFLSLQYAGNISAFSYGEDFLINNRSFYTSFFSKYNPDQSLVFPHFNQNTITGFDLGPYSFAGGLFYPVMAVQGNEIFREILSEKFSPIGVFKYTTDETRTEAILSVINLDSTNPSEDNIKLILAEEMSNQVNLSQASSSLIDQIESFDLDSSFLRINYEQAFKDDLILGLSEVLLQGRYQERMQGEDYRLNFQHLVTSVNMNQVFGDYVALKARLNYFIRQYRSETMTNSAESSDNQFSFSLAIEFFL